MNIKAEVETIENNTDCSHLEADQVEDIITENLESHLEMLDQTGFKDFVESLEVEGEITFEVKIKIS